MANQGLQLKKTDSIVENLTRMHEDIRRRAYDFFRSSEGLSADAPGDWLRAERDLIRRPSIELRQRNGAFELDADVAGVDPKDLDVHVAPQDILVKARTQHAHEKTEGTVHMCEFKSGELFRAVHLPQPIDRASVKTDCRNGVLSVTANIDEKMSKTEDLKVG